MKKLLFTAAIAVLGFTSVNAQDDNSTTGGFSKGDIFVSGAVGFGTESQADVKSNSFTISPKLGFFVTENIAAGLKLGYTSWNADNNGIDTLDSNEFTVGAFGRYFFTPANQFSVFAELGVDYSSENDKLADVKYNGFNLGVAPGINYFVSNNLSIEASFGLLGYSNVKGDWDNAEAKNNFELGVNLSDINFGLTYKF